MSQMRRRGMYYRRIHTYGGERRAKDSMALSEKGGHRSAIGADTVHAQPRRAVGAAADFEGVSFTPCGRAEGWL